MERVFSLELFNRMPSKKELSGFTYILGAALCAFGLYPLVRGADPRLWFLFATALLCCLYKRFPNSMVWPYRVWLAIGQCLGFLNTRIILFILFYILITPIGLFRRLLAEDPLHLKWERDKDTYTTQLANRERNHFKHTF